MRRCWAFHASSVPPEATDIVDAEGRTWQRTGSRLWTWDGLERHEVWLLGQHGPVRCALELTL